MIFHVRRSMEWEIDESYVDVSCEPSAIDPMNDHLKECYGFRDQFKRQVSTWI